LLSFLTAAGLNRCDIFTVKVARTRIGAGFVISAFLGPYFVHRGTRLLEEATRFEANPPQGILSLARTESGSGKKLCPVEKGAIRANQGYLREEERKTHGVGGSWKTLMLLAALILRTPGPWGE